MSKSSFKNILWLLIVGIFVEVCVSVFTILYVCDTFELQSKLLPNPEVLAYISLGVSTFIIIVCIIFGVIENKRKTKVDIQMFDVVGSDVEEAYNFGKLGLAVVNEDGYVLWTNDFIQRRSFDFVSKNIYDWEPKLKGFLGDNPVDKITIAFGSYSYEVKFLKAAGLYIFRDVTDYEFLFRSSNQRAVVLGIISIDNYSDLAAGNDDVNDVINDIKGYITKYASTNKFLIRSLKNDSYLVITTYGIFETLRKQGFTVLEDVRNIPHEMSIAPTLSIGFAYGTPDITDLNKMASEAIDIAMSRGGDQCVVNKYGGELEYFGGKTAAVEVVNKVKLRVFSDSLISSIKASSNILIMGHIDMDMDALGACLGVQAICDYCSKESKIIYEAKGTERKTRAAIQSEFSREEHSRLFISTKDCNEMIKPDTLLIVCDVSRPSITMYPQILEKVNKIILIDHHRRASEFIDSPVLQYIDPSASSSCELIAEMIKFNSEKKAINVSKTSATIMLSGIFLDTSFYKTKTTGSKTFEASMILKSFGADNYEADELLKDEFEEYALVNRIITTLKVPYYGTAYCVCNDDEIIERAILSKVANQVIQLKGVNSCFVIGRTEEKTIRISARSDGTVNVQKLMEKMGGGGHYAMAACAFENSTISKVSEELINVLSNYLGEARAEKEE